MTKGTFGTIDDMKAHFAARMESNDPLARLNAALERAMLVPALQALEAHIDGMVFRDAMTAIALAGAGCAFGLAATTIGRCVGEGLISIEDGETALASTFLDQLTAILKQNWAKRSADVVADWRSRAKDAT